MNRGVPIQVVTLADERFVVPLAVLVRSVLDHLGAERAIHLTVIDGGIRPETRALLESSWNDGRLTVAWRSPDYGGAVSLPVSGRIPLLTYARLMAPSLLAPDCERAIVLDADQMVLTDLGSLADLPFGGATLLAPRDMFIPTMGSINGLAGYRQEGLTPETAFFSGAVMVIHLETWRREDVSRRALDYVARNARELNTYDQDALNAVLRGRWREIDPRFQVQPRALVLKPSVTPHLDQAARALISEDPWIVHFSGRLKPWMYRGRSRFDDLFRETLSRTPFRDHRAPRNLESAFLRFYDGAPRRLAYPLEVRIDGVLRKLRRRREAIA